MKRYIFNKLKDNRCSKVSKADLNFSIKLQCGQEDDTACTSSLQRDMLACGKRILAVVCNDMTVRACGDNVQGQLGLGVAREIRTLSVVEMFDAQAKTTEKEQCTKTVMIAGTDSFVASVDTKGQVWMSGMFAEVVDKPNRYKMQILSMQIPTRIIFVATGHMHCLALSDDMHVFAAGKNWSGQLGVGNANVKYTKQLVPIASGPWDGHTSMITCGASFSAILTDDGAGAEIFHPPLERQIKYAARAQADVAAAEHAAACARRRWQAARLALGRNGPHVRSAIFEAG